MNICCDKNFVNYISSGCDCFDKLTPYKNGLTKFLQFSLTKRIAQIYLLLIMKREIKPSVRLQGPKGYFTIFMNKVRSKF